MTLEKIQHLRRYLLSADPWLQRNPESLRVSVAQGRFEATASPSMVFMWDYDIEVELLAYGGDIDNIAAGLFSWSAHYQSDLLQNPAHRREAFMFTALILDNSLTNITWVIPATERRRGMVNDGRLSFEFLPDPVPENILAPAGWSLQVTDEVSGETTTLRPAGDA